MSVSRGKIQGSMDPLVCEYVTTPDVHKELKRCYQTFLDINKAHVLMLHKQGIISHSDAKKILKVNQEMAAMGDEPTFEYDPGLEDIYPNLEKYLIDKVGIETGGRQHTARSRNDLTVTEERIDARRYFLEISELYNRVRHTILKLANETTDAVFAGYTCLQPSEPITMAHYWSAVLNGMQRDYDRIKSVWTRLNINPLGGCSMGSTSYPIDREMTSELLGFDSPMDNSLDSVAGLDYILEMMAAFSIAAMTLSRVATDLYVWSTPEFGYVEVGDSVAACSSIMPQKKNPVTLEYIRATAGNIEGLYLATWTGMKNTPYTLVVDTYTVAAANMWPMFEQLRGLLKIFNLTLETLTFHRERMFKMAFGNFCTVTELANAIVREDSVSFRKAHDVVAGVVCRMLEAGKTSDQITSQDINVIAEKEFHFKTALSDEAIRNAMNPVRIAEAKKTLGGPATVEVKRQLEKLSASLSRDDIELQQRQERVNQAKENLEKAVENLINLD